MQYLKRFLGGGGKERGTEVDLCGDPELVHASNVRYMRSQGIEPLSYNVVMDQLKRLCGEVNPALVRMGDMADNFSFYNIGPVTVGPEGCLELHRRADLVGGRDPIDEPAIRIGVNDPYFSLAVIEIPGPRYTEKAFVVNRQGRLEEFHRRWEKLQA